jgi:hypothetical protein
MRDLKDALLDFDGYEFLGIEKFKALLQIFDSFTEPGNFIHTRAFGGGALSVGRNFAEKGEVINITFIPELGYKLKQGSLRLNGDELNSFNFTMPGYSVVVTCEFEKIEQGVRLIEQNNSVVLFSHSAAAEGDKVFFSITPDFGYRIREGTIKVNGETVDGSYFIMPLREAVLTFEVERIRGINGGLSGGAIAGITIGSVSGAAGISVAIWWFVFRKKKIAGAAIKI